MTTNQLRTFLDAHGVPGAPTEAGEPSEVFYCEHTSDHGSAHVGHEFYTRRELAILCAGNAPLIIVRHAPLPDPTALMAEVGSLRGRVEKAEARARVLTNDVDALNRTCIEAQGRESEESARAAKAEADMQRERERADKACRLLAECRQYIPDAPNETYGSLARMHAKLTAFLGKDPTHG